MTRKRSNRPTMEDVASRAGVSQMTVSRVLRARGYVSDAARKRVLRAATELGYAQNPLAGGLRSQSAALIAVVLPTLDNRVFSEVLSGINAAADRAGCQTVFGVTEYDPAREEALVRDLLGWRPRGLVLAGLEHSAGTRRAIAASGVRVTEIMDLDGRAIDCAIGLSQQAAGRAMARHLLARGHRRFVCLGAQGGLDLRAAKRLGAFAHAVRQAGADVTSPRISAAPSSMQEGRRMTAALLAENPRPGAVVYANDDMAAGGLMQALAQGLAVPGDLALAGFNGLDFLDALPLRLTTVVTPRYAMGCKAVEILQAPAGAGATLPTHVDLGFVLRPGDTS